MDSNPCVTPQVSLEDHRVRQPEFFVVSAKKFAIMFIFTMGFYVIYWSYKNWKIYKQATGVRIYPGVRGLFSVLFIYALFGKVDRCIRESGRSLSWLPGWRAIAILLVTLSSMLIGRLADFNVVALFSVCAMVVQVSLLLGGQRAINFSAYDPLGRSNSKLTLINYLWLLIFSPAWIFYGLGLYLAFFMSFENFSG